MENENDILIYPSPDKNEQWEQSMYEAREKEFVTEEELTTCLEQGCMTGSLLFQIQAKINSYSSFNKVMIICLWRKITENLNLSADEWGYIQKIH